MVALKWVCTDIVLSLSNALSDYHRFKAHRDDSLRALEELQPLKAQKHSYLTQYQVMKSSRDQHQQRQTQLTNQIGLIHAEIAKLQAELGILEPELADVNAHIKVKDAQWLQLYSQGTALDNRIVPLVEKQKPLEHAVEVGSRGLAKAESSWSSLFQKFQEARLSPPTGIHLNHFLHILYVFKVYPF